MPKIIGDWIKESLYSTFVVDPNFVGGMPARWELFTYARSGFVSGSSRLATPADTNIPRSGDVGLPMSWEFKATSVHVSCNVDPDQRMLDWAASASVSFRYNDKLVMRQPLNVLLKGPVPVANVFADDGSKPPLTDLWIRENLGFSGTVEADPRATESLCEHLQIQQAAAPQDAITALNVLMKGIDPESGIYRQLFDLRRRLFTPGELSFRLHLNGELKRAVV